MPSRWVPKTMTGWVPGTMARAGPEIACSPRRRRRSDRLAPAPGRQIARARPRPAHRAPPQPPPDARPCGLDRRPGRSPQPRRGAPRAVPPAAPIGTPPSGRADDETSHVDRSSASRRFRCPRPRWRARAARTALDSRSGSPIGSAAASSNSRRASPDIISSRFAKLSSILPESACHSGSANPPANCITLRPRGSSSKASGLPRVSAMIRSRTR